MSDPNAWKYEPDVLDDTLFPVIENAPESEESDDPDWDLRKLPQIWHKMYFTEAEAPSPLENPDRPMHAAPERADDDWIANQMAEMNVEAQKQKSPAVPEIEPTEDAGARPKVFAKVPPVYTPHQPLGEWASQQPPLETTREPSPVRETPPAPPKPSTSQGEQRYFHGAPIPPPFELPPDFEVKGEDLPVPSLPTPAQLQRDLAPANLTDGEKCSPDPYIPPGYHPYERLRIGGGTAPSRSQPPQPGPSSSREEAASQFGFQPTAGVSGTQQQQSKPSQQSSAAKGQQKASMPQMKSPEAKTQQEKRPKADTKSPERKQEAATGPYVVKGKSPLYELGSPSKGSQRSPC